VPDNKKMISEKDDWTIEAMRAYGNGFQKQLAELATIADGIERNKIKSAWPSVWQKFSKLGQRMRQDSIIRPYGTFARA